MPELPEVETVTRGLATVLTGARIERVELRRADLRFPFPDSFGERLTGRRAAAPYRRAKFILVPLDSGETLIIHLGMSGRMTIIGADHKDNNAALAPHDHVVLYLEGGVTIRYNDARRFGFMTLTDTASVEENKFLKGLGPEPFGNSFHAAYLAERARGRSTPLKSFLLNQKNIAGLGNIYVCEALYRAHLSPTAKAAGLSRRDGKPTTGAERLVAAIRDVLQEAIAQGGSTLRDHRLTDGSLGYFQHTFGVYDREGQPCQTAGCPGMVKRITQAGRSTFFCPHCQR